MEIEFHDRYTTLGIPYPNPETMCKGHCEGTGVVPQYCKIDGVDGLLYLSEEDEDDPRLIDAWRKAHEKNHKLLHVIKVAWEVKDIKWLWRGIKCDGWHFVKCPDCDGTGKRKE